MISDPAIDRDIATIGRLPSVQRILEVVAAQTGMRFTVVARVDEASWTACAVHDQINFGLVPGGQLDIKTTLCDQVRRQREPVLFGQASADPYWSAHPIPAMYGIESYVSIPIYRSDGAFFGTLCAIDVRAAKLDDPALRQSLELYAQLIAAHLEAEERVADSDRELFAARDVARLREQFIAILGHDLQGPLHALGLGVGILRQSGPELAARGHLDAHLVRMERSCDRMQDLIRDLLDFARGRLGGGIPVLLHSSDALAAALEQVVSELQIAHPQRQITWRLAFDAPVLADEKRIAQLLGNLLGNAIAHGAADHPIQVSAVSDGDGFSLAVRNQGSTIPPEVRVRLFEPFWRASSDKASGGLGLGLYICAEIARAHGGRIEVASDAVDGTVFRFSMPPPAAVQGT